MSEKVVTEATMKRIATALTNQKTMLAAIAKGFKIKDWATVQDIVQSGLARHYFSIGDQFFITWKDGDYEYPSVPLDVVHFCNVRDADGNEHPGMILQCHYAMPFKIQFDASENTPTTDEVFQEGYYYYLPRTDGMYVEQTVEVGAPIPKEGTYVRNEFDNAAGIIRDGYNRWSHSGIRQWLNSDKPKGEWWEPQHDGDTPPAGLNQHDGFMKGLPADFLAVVKPIQVKCWLNDVIDNGKIEITVDRFFMPSCEEVYGVPVLAGEGEVWEYWKEAVGINNATNDENEGRCIYMFNAPSTKTVCYLRSAAIKGFHVHNNSAGVVYVNINGGVKTTYYYAGASEYHYCTPSCAIW